MNPLKQPDELFCSETWVNRMSDTSLNVTHTFGSILVIGVSALTATRHKNCYLLRFLCLMRNRFSSNGCVFATAFFSANFLFLNPLFLFALSGFGSDPCISPVQLWRSALLLLCPAGAAEGARFGFLLLFFFFISKLAALPPPLGKSSASSKISLGGGFLEVGTGLLGFHAFTLLLLSCCLCFLDLFVLGVGAIKSCVSLKKMWLELGLLLGLLWGVWLDLWLIFCFFFGGPGVRGVRGPAGKLPFFCNSMENRNKQALMTYLIDRSVCLTF